MTLAFYIAALPNQKKPVPLKDLLVDVDDDRPRRKQSWEEIKAALVVALNPEKE